MKDRLAKHMWMGVGINFAAMCIVSAPSFLGPGMHPLTVRSNVRVFAQRPSCLPDAGASPDGRDPRVGIMFIVLSCIIQGSQ